MAFPIEQWIIQRILDGHVYQLIVVSWPANIYVSIITECLPLSGEVRFTKLVPSPKPRQAAGLLPFQPLAEVPEPPGRKSKEEKVTQTPNVSVKHHLSKLLSVDIRNLDIIQKREHALQPSRISSWLRWSWWLDPYPWWWFEVKIMGSSGISHGYMVITTIISYHHWFWYTHLVGVSIPKYTYPSFWYTHYVSLISIAWVVPSWPNGGDLIRTPSGVSGSRRLQQTQLPQDI